jgi:hypothetical protein
MKFFGNPIFFIKVPVWVIGKRGNLPYNQQNNKEFGVSCCMIGNELIGTKITYRG